MKALKHFITITKHRHEVIKNCFRIGIGFQGLFHDLSKYSPQEFILGAKNYQGNRSPNAYEREIKGYSEAWMHHKGRNKHHYEYWNDYNPHTKRNEPVKMPIKYVFEMFCDDVAASKIYNGKAYKDDASLKYFLHGKEHKFIHPETSDLIESWLTMLAEKGEKVTFNYIKGLVKSKFNY